MGCCEIYLRQQIIAICLPLFFLQRSLTVGYIFSFTWAYHYVVILTAESAPERTYFE